MSYGSVVGAGEVANSFLSLQQDGAAVAAAAAAAIAAAAAAAATDLTVVLRAR